MKLLSTLCRGNFGILRQYVQKASIQLTLFASLLLTFSVGLHAQQDGFHVVHGAELSAKKHPNEQWGKDGYLFELKDDSKLEYYKKAVVAFDRLNEFRRAVENNRIPINENDGYLVVISWKELGIEGGREGQFARRKLKFVLNDNAQLKEQFLD